jgi:hypothetical protein
MRYQGDIGEKPLRFNVQSYLKKEFFNADKETFQKITELYRDLYGNDAYRYLLSVYDSWKSNRVSMTFWTVKRIVECVPRCLSDEKKFFILKNEVINFLQTIQVKKENSYSYSSLSEINSLFENFAIKIDKFNSNNLSHIISKKFFSSEEIENFIIVCKYILFEKLRQSYRQVCNDLILFKEKVSNIKRGLFSSHYHIEFLNLKIDLSNINEFQFNLIEFKREIAFPNGPYKSFAEQYILEEIMEMNYFEKKGALNRQIKSNDLNFFFEQYEKLKHEKTEAEINSDFIGEGGKLTISLEVKSISKIYTLIFLISSKLIAGLVILGTSIFFIFEFNSKNMLFIFLCCFVFIIYLIGFIVIRIEELKIQIKNLRKYGK